MNILHFIEFHPFITGASVLTALIGSFSLAEMFEPLLQKLGSFIVGLFFVQKYMADTVSSNFIYNYLNSKYRGFGISKEMFGASRHYVHPLEDEYIVWNRNKSNSRRLWIFKGRPILFWPNDDENDWGSYLFFRWTVDWVKLLKEAGEYDDQRYHCIKKVEKKFYIKNHVGDRRRNQVTPGVPNEAPEAKSTYDAMEDHEYLFWKSEDLGVGPKPDDPMGHLSIGVEAANLIRKVKFWYNNKDWYKDRNIIWKLGVLLYGTPGSGKTTLARAIAEDLDIPLHTFDLSSMDSEDFVRAWKDTQKDKPRIVVFEDFDTVFHGRENQIEGSTLEFGTILNAIDGLQREHGLLLFITTNKVEHIDEAMGCPSVSDHNISTRPGRIDLVMEMAGMDRMGRIKIANRILPGEFDLAEEMADKFANDTAAQFQYRCMKKALDILWGTDDGEV